MPINHLKGSRCYKCSIELRANKRKSKIGELINRANKIHKNFYDYSRVNYVNQNTNVKILCPKHGEFNQTFRSHLSGAGCYYCGCERNSENNLLSQDEFLKRCRAIHGNLYSYELSEYKGKGVKVKIKCINHGIFEQTPGSHFNGSGCPKCSKGNYSNISIKWLKSIEQNEKIRISHALNDGEYKIKLKTGRNLNCDGYCKKTNIVYEFYGCFWHGCPSCHEPSDRNRVNKKLFSELYEKTLKREEIIKKLGYSLITVWECKFKQ